MKDGGNVGPTCQNGAFQRYRGCELKKFFYFISKGAFILFCCVNASGHHARLSQAVTVRTIR